MTPNSTEKKKIQNCFAGSQILKEYCSNKEVLMYSQKYSPKHSYWRHKGARQRIINGNLSDECYPRTLPNSFSSVYHQTINSIYKRILGISKGFPRKVINVQISRISQISAKIWALGQPKHGCCDRHDIIPPSGEIYRNSATIATFPGASAPPASSWLASVKLL